MDMNQVFLAYCLGEPPTPEREAAFRRWWANVPDFIKPSYPFDVPPDRMLYARYVFTEVGDVPRTCPVGACRRTRQCQGGEGPPCYRARREELRDLLFEGWINIYHPEMCGEDEDDEMASSSAPAPARGTPPRPARTPLRPRRRGPGRGCAR